MRKPLSFDEVFRARLYDLFIWHRDASIDLEHTLYVVKRTSSIQAFEQRIRTASCMPLVDPYDVGQGSARKPAGAL